MGRRRAGFQHAVGMALAKRRAGRYLGAMTEAADRATAAGRAANRARWRQRSAAWQERVGGAPPVADATSLALIEAVGIRAGMRTIDLASGPGDPAIPIAERVAPGGLCVATDQAEEMLAAARRRGEAVAGRTLAFAVATMEELPFAAAAFDALTCRFGIMFPPDRVAAAAEARRVLRPGARAGYVVWGPVEDNVQFHLTGEVVAQASAGKAGDADLQRHTLGADGALAAVLTAAGFRDVTERGLKREVAYEPGAKFWQRTLGVQYGAWYATLDDPAKAALDDRFAAAFAAYRSEAGYALPIHIRLGVGVAP